MYPKPDIESKLNAIKQIQPEDSLVQQCDSIFEQHWMKHQKTFARHSSGRLNPLKAAVSWLVFPIAWSNRTHYRQAAVLSFAVILFIVCALIWTPQRGVLAATLEALQTVQSMKISTTTTIGNVTTRETVLWQHPQKMKVEQFTDQDTLQQCYWIDTSALTILDYVDKTVQKSGFEPSDKLYGIDGNRWITNATSPMQIVITYIDFIHQNWNSVSVRESQNNANPITTYTFDYGGGRTTELMIDAKTDLPLHLQYIYPANQNREREDTVFQFEWNLALHESEFVPDIPSDFTTKTQNETQLEEIPSISYPGGFHTNYFLRFDMNPVSGSPATAATVTGTVVDENNKPISNAVVSVSNNNGHRPTATTDSSGQFRLQFDFHSVEAGVIQSYEIHCLANGYARNLFYVQLDQYSPQADIDFILLPGASISGKVVDDNNQPVADATVYAYPRTVETKTNQQGEYILSGLGLDHETFDIFAYKDGYASGRTIAKRTSQQEPYYELESNPIIITTSQQQKISRLIQVVDHNLNPIQGAKIYVNSTETVYETREDGRFELKGYLYENQPNPAQHTQHVLVSKEGFAYNYAEVDLLNNTPYVITLIPGNTIKGKVVDENGNPVPGIQFNYTFQDTNYAIYTSMKMTSTPTDANGMFELTNINGEDRIYYNLSIPDYLPYIHNSGIYPLIPLDTSQYQNEPFVITLERVEPVEGNVYYKGTNDPVPFFTITFNRDVTNEYPKYPFQKDSGTMTVYQSTNGYFRTEFVTDPIKGYQDTIRIRVKEGYGTLIPNSKVHIFTYTLDEIKSGKLRIEIPKPE